MPPPLPSQHRGMTANPLKPGRYRPGKAIAEEPSSSEEEEEEEDAEAQARERERRRREQQQRLKQRAQAPAPKASSFPAGKAAPAAKEDEDDEEGFVTEEEEEEEEEEDGGKAQAPRVAGDRVGARAAAPGVGKDESEEEESEEEEESSEEESSSEDETPRRVLLRPTFIKKDKRNTTADQGSEARGAHTQNAAADSAAETEARRAQRQEKADTLIREQLEKDAIARSAANKAWDDDEQEAAEEGAIDDRDGVDPEAEYAAWKLRELKRVKREREAIEEAEKEREEIERRRNLTAEERDREDREYIAKQKEEKEASRGDTGYMKRYFHKGAFFRDDLEREGLDKRDIMGSKFVDEVSRETLPQYMQIRDMTKLGKKGRTRYRDLKSEDTGRFGDGFENRRRRDGPPGDVTDERFLPDRGDDRPRGPTGANAGPVRERRRSRSRSRSPRRDRRDRSRDRYPDNSSRRKRSPSPYEDREKRRRTAEAS